jgi:hypothetical protein
LATLKVAVTDLSEFIVKVQVLLVPEQSPDQPAKVEPESAVAVRVTVVPPEYRHSQTAPQLIPGGSEVTVPEPFPDLETVSRYL